MNIVVLVKEVLDPDAVNAFAIGRQLRVDAATGELDATGIPLVINGYDEQAIEAAMRLRDSGIQCHITALSVGCQNPGPLFMRVFALGADDGYVLQNDTSLGANGTVLGEVLASAISHVGGADLVLCGRQASDDDQGVVGPATAAALGVPCVTLAKKLEVATADGTLHVTRVIPDGEEEVEVTLPAVVTVSSEIGDVRFPKASDLLTARRKKPSSLTAAQIGLDVAGQATASVIPLSVALPQRERGCEMMKAGDVKAMAAELVGVLRAEGLL